MDNLLAGNLIPPFSGRFACRVVIQRCSPFGCGNHSGIKPITNPDRPIDDRIPVGVGDRLQPGTMIGIIPES
jgi:hypothetical protein